MSDKLSLLDSLFGGSKQSSTSSNKAYDYIKEAYSPIASGGAGIFNSLQGLLTGNNPAAFDAYKNSTGYNFRLNEGLKGITSNAATRGLLNSGATLKALNRYSQDYASGEFSNYLNQLSGLLGTSLNAGNLIASTGQTSSSTGKSSGGIISGIGSLF